MSDINEIGVQAIPSEDPEMIINTPLVHIKSNSDKPSEEVRSIFCQISKSFSKNNRTSIASSVSPEESANLQPRRMLWSINNKNPYAFVGNYRNPRSLRHISPLPSRKHSSPGKVPLSNIPALYKTPPLINKKKPFGINYRLSIDKYTSLYKRRSQYLSHRVKSVLEGVFKS